ncbi:MAG: type II toxin-antitoxin system RelE/ParE family toxin [Nanoarchaeota archaeon]|nr:type II toxin-antitoxin system RelE/ParE family toxin [Nanoarchaeota archaeon]
MNLNNGWKIVVHGNVEKQLAKIPWADVVRIRHALRELIFNPYDGDAQKLGGEESVWRRRVGNYRIKYEILKNERVMYVFDVERRTSRTY